MEGNVVQKIIAGDWWGPSGPGNTYFRNRIETDDIIMQDATHSQNIVANEILNGTVSIIQSDNTWQLSNKNGNGFIDNEFSGTIETSLYYDSKPDFMDGYAWPAIGPEFTLNQNTIPAKARWDDNGMDLVPCLDVGLITSINEPELLFEVYPNPTNGIVNINGYQGRIQVLSLDARLIKESINGTIDISNLSKGLYLLYLESVNQTTSILLK